MFTWHDIDEFADHVESVYVQQLKGKLEPEHNGQLIAVEPESGEYVLGSNYHDVSQAAADKFGSRMTHMFRIGGGGAVKIGAGRERLS